MIITFGTIFIICFGFIGGSIASFLGVVFERVPKGESINGRSVCACGRQLKWYENVPIIGWLRIKGTAKCCGAKLPVHYLMTEIIGFIIFAVIGLVILLNL